MNRLVIVARLRKGTQDEAERLLREGPPFDPEQAGLERHAAYLSATEVVFVFEAPEVEWVVDEIIDDPVFSVALAPWRDIVEGAPRLARERYYWAWDETKTGVGLGL